MKEILRCIFAIKGYEMIERTYKLEDLWLDDEKLSSRIDSNTLELIQHMTSSFIEYQNLILNKRFKSLPQEIQDKVMRHWDFLRIIHCRIIDFKLDEGWYGCKDAVLSKGLNND